MLYVEYAPLSSLCDVGLPPQHSALIFQAACADYFADTTMSKGPSFQLYVPLIFEFLWKLLWFSIYSSLVVLKLAKIWANSCTTTLHYKAQKGSPRITFLVSEVGSKPQGPLQASWLLQLMRTLARSTHHTEGWDQCQTPPVTSALNVASTVPLRRYTTPNSTHA